MQASPEQTAPPEMNMDGLGVYLRQRFTEVAAERNLIEQEWLKSLRQYEGVYESEDAPVDHQGSKAFFRLTRTRVRTTTARQMETLFPGGERNYAIEATPEPNLAPEIINFLILQQALTKLQAQVAEFEQQDPEVQEQLMAEGVPQAFEEMQAMIQQGQIPPQLQPNEETVKRLVKDEAKRRAERMATTIDDQLTETKYRKEAKKVLHSGNLFGTGWLKGPLAESRAITRWVQGEQGEWVVDRKPEKRPFPTFVSIWNLFPDSLDANDVEELEGMFERHVMPKHKVRRLKRRGRLFKADVIDQYLRDHPNGDSPQYLTYETELRALKAEDQGSLNRNRLKRYEVLEWTGYADAHMLAEAGVEVGEDMENAEFKANVWILGDQVIKATLYPFDDENIQTYHRYVFEESENSINGIGIPEIFRDSQRGFNAAMRAVFDNLGESVRPLREVNVSLLDAADRHDVNGALAERVILRKGDGADAQYPAIRQYETASRVNELLAVANLMQDIGDDSTGLPRYAAGSEKGKGAAETATGLSILMGNAEAILKDPIANYDEGITKPFIKAMVHWNMQFNPDKGSKGDYEVQAKGSSTLMAKEVYTKQLDELANNTNNPTDLEWIKRGELNRERFKVRDLDTERFVRTDDEHDELMQQMAEQAAAQAAVQQQPQAA